MVPFKYIPKKIENLFKVRWFYLNTIAGIHEPQGPRIARSESVRLIVDN